MNICSFLLLSERPTCIRYVHSQHDYGGDTYPFRKTADQVPRKSIAVLVWRKFVHAGAQTFGTPQEAGWSSSTAQLQYVPRDEADAVVTSNHVQVERAIDQSINQSINQDRVAVCRLIPFRSHSPWDMALPDSLLDFRSCNGGNGLQPGRSRGKLFTVWGGLVRGSPVRTTVIHLRSDL